MLTKKFVCVSGDCRHVSRTARFEMAHVELGDAELADDDGSFTRQFDDGDGRVMLEKLYCEECESPVIVA